VAAASVIVSRGVEVVTQTTHAARRDEIMRRAGKDICPPMNDEIPYDRWERERQVINRAGYRTWFELLKDRHAKNN
jgi:hypothetical protein